LTDGVPRPGFKDLFFAFAKLGAVAAGLILAGSLTLFRVASVGLLAWGVALVAGG
jgi:hypothetical protein